MSEYKSICFGEFMGTFLLVFLGTSAVAAAVLFDALIGGAQVALVWGGAVTLAIYATRHLSCAHLNPAVSLGMVLVGRMRARLLLPYWISQLLGGIAAGALLLLLFHTPMGEYERAHGLVRGTLGSLKTAMMFGEYFPNPAVSVSWSAVPMGTAMLVEGVGTFLLVSMIFLLTQGCNVGRPGDALAPVFIGGTVAAIICVFAPMTQAGINPARDFGPRIVAFLAGWKEIAIPGPRGGFCWVYILSPLLGGVGAAVGFRWVMEPLMAEKAEAAVCGCSPPEAEGAPSAGRNPCPSPSVQQSL